LLHRPLDHSNQIEDAIRCLNEAGLVNPLRVTQLILQTVSALRLDLKGFTVLTEAASGPFVVTPVLAAVAGAKKVIALTSDSRYASASSVTAQTRALESLCGTSGRVEIYTERSSDLVREADIVTNVGFVRPIDSQVIGAMKHGAVIPLMCEAWEFRVGDVDLDACRSRNIHVLGTNEDHAFVNVMAHESDLSELIREFLSDPSCSICTTVIHDQNFVFSVDIV